MSNKKQSANKGVNRNIIIGVVAAVLLVVSVIIFFTNNRGSDNTAVIGDIVITKSEITQTVKLYPIKVGKVNMEVMTAKASDGTIRTAFNTCQVCNGSPKAYYKQEGDIVVCQNCGNQFSMDMIEVQRGGCNPIPIMSDDKTDSGDTITISGEFIKQNSGLFTENWKSR